MNIRERTSERLILVHRERGVPLGFAAMALLMAVMAGFAFRGTPAISLGLLVIALMLAAVALFTFSDESVEFSRPTGRVVIRSGHPLRRTPKSMPLRELREAVAQTRGGNASEIGYKGHRATRPVLVRRGSDKVIPLAPSYADPEDTQVVVQAINDWLGVRPSRRASR
jgi:hypothetical protein